MAESAWVESRACNQWPFLIHWAALRSCLNAKSENQLQRAIGQLEAWAWAIRALIKTDAEVEHVHRIRRRSFI